MTPLMTPLVRKIRIPALAMFAAFLLLHGSAAMGQSSGYGQQYRPQVHFSPQQHWTNDPNGLVYFKGEYHLFYQYNPFGDVWGHMSWGHAVSSDLLHWHELPVALPEQNGVMIFTGSVVVDRTNSSGLCTAGTECLVAIYTGDGDTPQGHRETQNIAVSNDSGRTWTKYEKNPVLDLHLTDFRDPGVFWEEEAHQWIMAVSLPKERKVRFYASANLKEWNQLSDFGPAGDVAGDWECPNLLRVPGDNGAQSRWVLKVGLNPGAPQGGSGEQYFFGSFDGKTFAASDAPGAHGWTNYGKDDYCAISYNGLPRGDRPVLIGWMSNWQYAAKLPTSPWRGQMSLPRRLSYIQDASGLALKQEPVIAPLREKAAVLSDDAGKSAGEGMSGTKATVPYELSMDFGRPKEPIFGLRLYSDPTHWTEIGFDTDKRQFYIDRTRSGQPVDANFPVRTEAPIVSTRSYDVKLIVDRSSVEAYAQDGTIAMTDLIFPLSEKSTIEVFPRTKNTQAAAAKTSGKIWELKSVWQP